MAAELVYTSVAQGLNKGESGFCVVARSAEIPPLLQNRLEALSGYREIYNALDPRAKDNPVNFANTLIACGKERFAVISRIGFAGLDYTGRSNKIADHLILHAEEMAGAGPAELLSIKQLFYSTWDQPAVALPRDAKLIPHKPVVDDVAEYWIKVTGSAGWAEHLLELSRRHLEQPLYIISKPGIDNLALVREVLRLLPIAEQWQYTFSTYCSSNIHGINYRWRFIFPETDIYNKVKNNSRMIKFDLNDLPPQMLKAKLDSNTKSKLNKTLCIRPLRQTSGHERFKPELVANMKSDYEPRARRLKTRWLVFIWVALLLLLLMMMIYRFFASNNATPGERIIADGLKHSGTTVNDSKPAKPLAPHHNQPLDNEAVKIKTVEQAPFFIVLDKQMRKNVKLKIPLRRAVMMALTSSASDSPVAELQFIAAADIAKSLAGKYGSKFSSQLITARTTIVMHPERAVNSVVSRLSDGILSSEFMRSPGKHENTNLLSKIKSRLAEASGGVKTFYENSAEYLLGELYVKFQRQYALKKRNKPERLIANDNRLLQAFFCFGKNYMPEAEKIIAINKITPENLYLKTIIMHTTIAQQLSYEQKFKTALDSYVYRQVLIKLINDMQQQVQKLRMSFEYNTQNNTINLIIEDDNHEKP